MPRNVFLAAKREGVSINAWIEKVLAQEVEKALS
ncbi:MAG: toxin-antitoxin system HicB family antitoxin [Prochlorothrix sp.]